MLSNNITKYREKKNITKYKLSKLSGVNESLISQIERGKATNPKISTLMRLAAALDVTVNDLIEGMEVPK